MDKVMGHKTDEVVDPRAIRIAELEKVLKPHEVEFAYLYIQNGYNGRKAVQASNHYNAETPNSAYVQSSLLLRDPKICELVGLIAERSFVEAKVSTTRILEHLANRAFFDIRNYYVDGNVNGALKSMDQWTDEEAAAVDGVVNTIQGYTGKGEEKQAIVRQELKMANPDKSLEMLGKYQKLFSDMMVDVHVNLADEIARARKRRKANDVSSDE